MTTLTLIGAPTDVGASVRMRDTSPAIMPPVRPSFASG